MFNGRLSEMQVRDVLRQVVEALIHCHNCGVFYCDVKTENILVNLNDWTVGLSTKINPIANFVVSLLKTLDINNRY